MKKPVKNQTPETAPEDAALFRAAIGKVKPLPQQNRIAPQPAAHKILPRRSASPPVTADTWPAFSASDPGQEAPDEFLSNGISRRVLRKLRQGGWPIEDSLDLHGNTSDAARKLLQAFLHEATQRNLRCVLVIHGKGLNSEGGEAVLRRLTRLWLIQHQTVLGFCNAAPRNGGSGAVLVLLRTASAASL